MLNHEGQRSGPRATLESSGLFVTVTFLIKSSVVGENLNGLTAKPFGAQTVLTPPFTAQGICDSVTMGTKQCMGLKPLMRLLDSKPVSS